MPQKLFRRFIAQVSHKLKVSETVTSIHRHIHWLKVCFAQPVSMFFFQTVDGISHR